MRQLAPLAFAGVLAASMATAMANPHSWQRFVDPVFGTTALYPPQVFKPLPPKEDTPGQAFLSTDGSAKLAIGAWDNRDNEGPGTFKDRLLEDGKHASLTYHPRGKS